MLDHLFGLLLRALNAQVTGAKPLQVQNLSTKDIADLEMTIPPLRDQMEIVEQLEVIEAQTARLRQIYLNQSENLTDLRQSLLQKAFAGELT